MNSLKWSEGLALDLPLMDQTHMEFVELLQVVDAAGDDSVLAITIEGAGERPDSMLFQ